MDNKSLHYFVTIVEAGTISAAARQLNMSQPPLSLSMKKLEEELGVTLLIRGPHKISCTEAGLVLYHRAKDILALCDFCRREVADIDAHMQGTIHLGVISSSEEVLLSDKMDQFIKSYPNINFELSEANTYEQIDNLEKRIIDAAIVRTPFHAAELAVRKLQEEPLVFVGNEKYFTKQGKIRLKDIEGIPLILYRRYYDLFMRECHNAKIDPQILCINEDARTTLAWATHGYGLGLLPRSVAKKAGGKIIYRGIDHEHMQTQVMLIWKEDQYLNHITKAFIECFTKVEDRREINAKN